MKCRSLSESFSHAIEGIGHTIHNERNMKIHIIVAFLVICLSAILKISAMEFALIFFAIGLVLVSEMFNTAIEVVVDMIYQDFNSNAKIAKDVASGASFMAAIIAVLIGTSVFGWRILEWINRF